MEALPVSGDVPALFPAQRLTATVLELNGQQALIDLKGVRVTVAALPGLQPGVEFFVQVAQVAPKLLLEVAPRPTKASTQLPPLAVGQEIEAEVVEASPGETVLVKVQGALLEAEAPKTLRPGTIFSARVEQVRPQVVLHVLSQSEEGTDPESVENIQAEASRLVRIHLPHRTDAGDSLHSLNQELASFVEHPPQDPVPSSLTKLQTLIKTLLPDQTPPTAERLAAFVRDGGLHYEAKLWRLAESAPQALSQMAGQDLKGLLLQALQDVETAQAKTQPGEEELVDSLVSAKTEEVAEEVLRELAREGTRKEPASTSPASQNIAASLVHHLENIESQQAVNVLAQVKGEPYQLQIPFFTGQGMTTAFLSIEPEGQSNGEGGKRKSGEKGKGCNILFLLDLEGFGKTRIDARVGEQSLWVAFYVDQPHTVSLLKEEIPAFRETLQSLGYGEVLIVAKPLGQLSAEKRQKFDALTLGVPSSVHLLDVRA